MAWFLLGQVQRCTLHAQLLRRRRAITAGGERGAQGLASGDPAWIRVSRGESEAEEAQRRQIGSEVALAEREDVREVACTRMRREGAVYLWRRRAPRMVERARRPEGGGAAARLGGGAAAALAVAEDTARWRRS